MSDETPKTLIVLTGPQATRLAVLLSEKRPVIVSSPLESPSKSWAFFHVTKRQTPIMSENKIRLAHIHIEQADVARSQGNIDSAVEYFTKAINLYKEMADGEPACYVLIADTIERVAATYKAAGQLKKAEETFAEAVQLREAIAKREAESED